MATRNLSEFASAIPSSADMRIGIVVSEWNSEVTNALRDGAIATLKANGCKEENIIVRTVPGTYELAFGARLFAEHTDVDGVIALGCVVQGETRHFDFVCQGVTTGINQVMLEWDMPVAFGVLTTDNIQQALDRAGGKYGNKGDEAASTVIRMIHLQREFEHAEEIRIVHQNVN